MVQRQCRAAMMPLVPLVWMAPAGCYTLFALFAGSNLWPLVLIFLSPLALLFLLGLLLSKRLRA